MKIGITGGIGCGKTTALNFFKKKGAIVIDCDALTNIILNNDYYVRFLIKNRWKNLSIYQNNKINKLKLAKIVFKEKNRNHLYWLENIIHFRIIKIWQTIIDKNMEESSNSDIFIEVPLLFEKHLERFFDYTICIVSKFNLVKNRLKKNKKISIKSLKKRRKIQMPLKKKIFLSNFIINNNTSIIDFNKKLDFIFNQLQIIKKFKKKF
jgi:dephospho-CoA kinase